MLKTVCAKNYESALLYAQQYPEGKKDAKIISNRTADSIILLV